jgi:hypothetical protein
VTFEPVACLVGDDFHKDGSLADDAAPRFLKFFHRLGLRLRAYAPGRVPLFLNIERTGAGVNSAKIFSPASGFLKT